MTKTELIEHIQGHTGLSNAGAARALHITLLTITRALKKGDSVTLTGFGTFSVAKRAARVGRNPRTGEAIKIKAAKVPKFSPGQTLRDAVK